MVIAISLLLDLQLTWDRHWPVGLLYDLFTGHDPSTTVEDDRYLPWCLSLHFRNYPLKHLLRLDKPSACYDAWMNNVKEVCLLTLNPTD